jgi:tetratricopeptide (TPR) repeat protein
MLGLCEFQLREYERSLIDLQKGRILGIGDNLQLTSVTRYHAAILLARLEQFEQGYEVLREFAREQNDSPNVIEAMGINVLRMPFLPSEIQPEKRELIVMAGRAAYEMAARHAENARVDFQELVARYPSTPNVHYTYGVFLVTSNPDAALEEFRRELQVSPSHFAAMLQLAFEYLKRGDPKTGLPYAQEAVQLRPKLFAARNALGRILLELGEVGRAIKELEEGVKLAPDSPEMHFALARAYARTGRKEDAARERAMFLRLDKIQRSQRSGAQSVGGLEAKPDTPPPR